MNTGPFTRKVKVLVEDDNEVKECWLTETPKVMWSGWLMSSALTSQDEETP